MHIDLHTHTTCSDGGLTPVELLDKARQRGVTVLSITDHDTVAAHDALAGIDPGLTLIPGIEWSACWRHLEIHVVGLRIHTGEPALHAAIDRQLSAREERAGRIASKLAKLGVEDPLEGARTLAGDGAIGRPHFARHMVESGFVRNENQAFRRYLAAGKSAWCRTDWASMRQVIEWTHAAGGCAVLAHPAHYSLSRTRLGELIAGFRQAGGDAMEVVSGNQQRSITAMLAGLCRKHGLKASCGSDYHRTAAGGADPGAFADLPSACTPVWTDWHDCIPARS